MARAKPQAPKTEEITEERLNELCLEWQTRLRLLDWAVTVQFSRRHELDDADGDCDAQLTLKRAKIRVVCEQDFVQFIEPYDPESILCHELLHLHFLSFSPADWNTPTGVAMEQAIDLIANGLVRAKRGQ